MVPSRCHVMIVGKNDFKVKKELGLFVFSVLLTWPQISTLNHLKKTTLNLHELTKATNNPVNTAACRELIGFYRNNSKSGRSQPYINRHYSIWEILQFLHRSYTDRINIVSGPYGSESYVSWHHFNDNYFSNAAIIIISAKGCFCKNNSVAPIQGSPFVHGCNATYTCMLCNMFPTMIHPVCW